METVEGSVASARDKALKMMSRQACFYRVPPQGLHRRDQLLAESTKTRVPLHNVIDVKVGGRGGEWGVKVEEENEM